MMAGTSNITYFEGEIHQREKEEIVYGIAFGE
jgi:hypothetical protein